MTAGSEGPDPYLLGYRAEEQERLLRQAEELAGDSERLFDEIGVGEGWRVVEIGCGPLGCLELLSRRVGPRGRVVGIERSAQEVARAQAIARERGLSNVEVRCTDARHTELAAGSFDLATARLVLVNVPKPEEIVAEMVRLVRPGGVVALHEADARGNRIDPPLPAFARLLDLLAHYGALNGIDRNIAPRVPRLLREAGVVDVRIHPFVDLHPPGHSRRFLFAEFVANTRSRLIESGLIAADELDSLAAALRKHLEDPDTLTLSGLYLQAWGRKR
jgi:SAM-dependent methyltransferase